MGERGLLYLERALKHWHTMSKQEQSFPNVNSENSHCLFLPVVYNNTGRMVVLPGGGGGGEGRLGLGMVLELFCSEIGSENLSFWSEIGNSFWQNHKSDRLKKLTYSQAFIRLSTSFHQG